MELISRKIKALFKKYGIEKHHSENKETKSSVAERGIRTLKTRLYKMFTAKKTLNWIDALPHLISAINRSYCRTIGMRPIDVTQENYKALWDKLYKAEPKNVNVKFNLGDFVRLARAKGKNADFQNY